MAALSQHVEPMGASAGPLRWASRSFWLAFPAALCIPWRGEESSGPISLRIGQIDSQRMEHSRLWRSDRD